MSVDREQLKQSARRLAEAGVLIGASSWKYPGWRGMIYDESRYVWRGRFAKSRFERDCLKEYAETFNTVCVDAAYYAFPSVDYLEGLASQVSADFRFAFKVTDQITVKRFPNLPRFGRRAGTPNEHFLNASLFESEFLTPCERIRPHVGLLMFEFSRFYAGDYEHGRDFVEDLDGFFSKIPNGWPYAVEIRNGAWLKREYFDCLARHHVTHVYNSWTEMPPISEQIALPGSGTNPDMVAARFLLKPGRRYEEAVKAFHPYEKAKEANEEARTAGAALIIEGKKCPGRRTFIFVNNRLEGNALETIRAMQKLAGAAQ